MKKTSFLIQAGFTSIHINDIGQFVGYDQTLIFVLQVGFIQRTVGRESWFWLGLFLQGVALSISRRRDFIRFISEHTQLITSINLV